MVAAYIGNRHAVNPMFNLDEIASLTDDTTAINATLRPSSVVLIGAMFDTLNAIYKWQTGDGGELSPAQIDLIDEMIAGLYSDIETELEVLPEYPFSFARIGMIFAVPSAIATFDESGLLYCNGSVHQKDDYPLLYLILNEAYILTEDTFFVPDLRGRMLMGNGDGGLGVSYPMAQRGGHHEHQLSVSQLPPHAHPQTYMASSSGSLKGWASNPDSSSSNPQPMADTGLAGGNAAHNNMPPYEVIRWYIVAT